jgi:hypothetical protein
VEKICKQQSCIASQCLHAASTHGFNPRHFRSYAPTCSKGDEIIRKDLQGRCAQADPIAVHTRLGLSQPLNTCVVLEAEVQLKSPSYMLQKPSDQPIRSARTHRGQETQSWLLELPPSFLRSRSTRGRSRAGSFTFDTLPMSQVQQNMPSVAELLAGLRWFDSTILLTSKPPYLIMVQSGSCALYRSASSFSKCTIVRALISRSISSKNSLQLGLIHKLRYLRRCRLPSSLCAYLPD